MLPPDSMILSDIYMCVDSSHITTTQDIEQTQESPDIVVFANIYIYIYMLVKLDVVLYG